MNMPWPLRLNEHTLSTMPSMPVLEHVCRRSVCDSPKSIMMIVVFCFLPVVAVIGATFVSATTPTTLSQVFVLPHEYHHIVHSNQRRYFHGGHHVVYHTQQIRKDQCILLNASAMIIDVVSGKGQVCPRVSVVDLVEDVGRYGQMTYYYFSLFG
jgi:hypothetical protein